MKNGKVIMTIVRKFHGAELRRRVEEESITALDDVVELMADPDWRMRAEAVAALISIGEPARTRMEALLDDDREPVRIAAARALLTMTVMENTP